MDTTPELRTAPDKPDPRFWDDEAQKLMLIAYSVYSDYSNASFKRTGIGSRGLRVLGFRGRGVGTKCPITRRFGRRLVNACRRLAKQIREQEDASTVHRPGAIPGA